MSLRKVRVKTISQQIFEFEVPEDMLISAFKEEIYQKTQVPIDRQRLIFMGKMVHDTARIGDIIKEDNQTLHLMAMTQPPQQQPQQQQQAQQTQRPQQSSQQGLPFQNVIQMQFSTMPGQSEAPDGLNQLTSSISNLIGSLVRQGVQPNAPQNQFQGGQQRPNQPHQHNHNHNHNPNQNQNHNQGNNHNNNHNHNHQHNQDNLQEVQIGDSQPLNQSAEPIQLPFNILHHLSRTVDTAFGQNVIFPGPPIPPAGQRNSIQLLGSYLHNLCFGLQRSLPLIQRTADLLQREPQMQNALDRRATERMARLSANLLNDMQRAVSVFQLLRLMQLGDQAGQGRLYVPRRENQQQQPQQPQQQPQQQSQQQQPQSPQPQSQQQDDSEEVVTDFHNIQIQLGEDNQNLGQIPMEDLQSGLININSLSQLPNIISQLFSQPQGQAGGQQPQTQPPIQSQQQTQPQSQQETSQQQRIQEDNQQGVQGQNPSPFNNPLAMIGSMFGQAQQSSQQQQRTPSNLFTMSVRDLMTQNYENQFEEGDQELLEIFADVKMGDLMGAQMTGNWSFFDNLHPRIKEQLKRQIEQCGGEQNLAQKLGSQIVSTICPEEQDQHRVLEGFEPQEMARDVIHRNLQLIFIIIDRDYTGQMARFSTELVGAFVNMVGECVYEVSEGLTNGMDDYKIIFQHNMQTILNKHLGAEMAGMFQALLSEMVWGMCLKAYEKYKVKQEQQQLQTQQEQQGQLSEEQLIQQITEAAQNEEGFQRYTNIQLSEEYQMGNPHYKEF